MVCLQPKIRTDETVEPTYKGGTMNVVRDWLELALALIGGAALMMAVAVVLLDAISTRRKATGEHVSAGQRELLTGDSGDGETRTPTATRHVTS
jgi:hypothetical protein